MLAMGVCGTVLVALGSTLGDLASNFGGITNIIYIYWLNDLKSIHKIYI